MERETEGTFGGMFEGIVVVSVQGRQDSQDSQGEVGRAEMNTACKQAQERLTDSLQETSAIIVDLSQASYLTEEAIASLITLWREARFYGSVVVLAGGAPPVQRKLRRMELVPLITLYPDIKAAQAALAALMVRHSPDSPDPPCMTL